MAPNVKTVVFASALYSAFSFATFVHERAFLCPESGWSTDKAASAAATAQMDIQPSNAEGSVSASMFATTSVASATSVSADSASAIISSNSSSEYSGSCDKSSPCTGQMTYYDTATSSSNPSSCGTTDDGNTEFVLALPFGIMTNSDCGRTVSIEYNGITQTGKVVDKCTGCDDFSIDLSRALFQVFASLSEGRLDGAKWCIN